MSIGRVNFEEKKIIENFKSVIDILDKELGSRDAINSIYISSSMGPSAKLTFKEAI